MDLFTHVLTTYLLTYGLFGFQPQYLAAGAIAGGLPDGDILLFPIARRFPILRHHGITHSFTGVAIIAVLGTVVAQWIAPGSPILYFALLFIGGSAHVLEDAFTNFSVPPFLPFSERRWQFDADRAINFGTLVISVASFYLLLGVERNHVAFGVYLATVWALMAFFVAYFGLRLALRVHHGRNLARYGPFTTIVATSSPFTWLLLAETKTAGRMRTVYGRLHTLTGRVEGPYAVEAAMDDAPGPAGPVTGPAAAIERSYAIARRAQPLLDDSYVLAEAEEKGGNWAVTWFSLEFAAFGRAAAVRVAFDAEGHPTTRRAWYAPRGPVRVG
ncbi:MAG: metal-dependent hydrolase [Thermoplasmata archaeon]|nr:metal-dependent hydrolase [Thermoplasmata archaeon]